MIPASITVALDSLQTQVTAALPLEAASRPAIQALQLNAQTLVAAIDAALANAATLSTSGTIGLIATLDNWTGPIDPEGMISGVNAMLVSATDQWALAVMRGLVGRVASNLDQLGPIPATPSKIYTPITATAPIVQPPESGMSFMGKFSKMNLKQLSYNR